MTSHTYNSVTRINENQVCSYNTFLICFDTGFVHVKRKKPALLPSPKIKDGGKKKVRGTNLKFDLQSESYRSTLAIIHFYDA